MFDAAETAADLALLLGPEDECHFVGPSERTRRSGRVERGLIYVVVHRRHGPWTHVYRVVEGDVPGRLLVFLEKAIEGDQREAAAAWAASRLR